MAGPAQSGGSVWDMLSRMAPQSSGIMKASDALGMGSQTAGAANSKAALTAQLALLKAKGPPDGHFSKAWDDQMKALAQQAADAK